MTQVSRMLASTRKAGTQRGRAAVTPFSKWGALAALGPVVYAMRLDGGVIKIGYTSNLAERERTVRRQSGSTSSEILAIARLTYEDEQAIHSRLTVHRAHGREYYQPTAPVLAEVNALRADFGMPPCS